MKMYEYFPREEVMRWILALLVSGLMVCRAVADDGLVCSSQGICWQGNLVTSTMSASEEECLSACKNTEQCQWYSYYGSQRKVCALFSSCPSINADQCQFCTSGQKQCGDQLQCGIESCCGPEDEMSFSTDSEQKCLTFCKNSPGCNWYTFKAKTYECFLFNTCPSPIQDASCSSGQRDCPDSPPPTDRALVVVAGLTQADQTISDVEVLALNGPHPSPASGLIIPKYPYTMAGAHGFFHDDALVICGGYMNQCLQLNDHGQWIDFPDLPTPLVYFAGSRTPNGYWVTGGFVESKIYGVVKKTSLFDGQKWIEGPDLPEPLYSHCQVQLSDSLTMIIGGFRLTSRAMSSRTWIYDWGTHSWRLGPELKVARRDCACGRIKDENGSYQVMVAGGLTNDLAKDTHLVSTELYNPSLERWDTGNRLPVKMTGAALVEDDLSGGLFLVGGRGSDGQPLDQVYFLPNPKAQWTSYANLTTARSHAIAAIIHI